MGLGWWCGVSLIVEPQEIEYTKVLRDTLVLLAPSHLRYLLSRSWFTTAIGMEKILKSNARERRT